MILQNYENLITNLIKDYFSNKIIEENFLKSLRELPTYQKELSLEEKLLTQTYCTDGEILDRVIKLHGADAEDYLEKTLSTHGQLYMENYDLVLMERLAQLKSISRLLHSLQGLDVNLKISAVFNHMKLLETKRVYCQTNSYYIIGPTLEYMNELEQAGLIEPSIYGSNEAQKVRAMTSLANTTGERLRYRLPIDINEYKQLTDETDKARQGSVIKSV